MKQLVILMTLICSFLCGGWEDCWSNAVECCISKDYLQAEKHFSVAIAQLEQLGDFSHPHVWVDRARLYSLLDRNEEALKDLTIAFNSPSLNGEDYKRALVTRIVTLHRLGLHEEAAKDMVVFREIFPIPKLEVYEHKVIVRNIPDCDCAQQLMKNYIATIFCESENDVMISNGICIAKRKLADCSCAPAPYLANVENCKYWCDKFAFAGQIFCAGTFKFFRCQAICLGTVEALKDGCYWCCNGGTPYATCIKPFADIVGQMGGFCDPAWD